ncbi:hypothetical protein PUNSTDRAFT_44597 [Punctularia strigosozonata HHB-11173 SS5]|uniref:uncharacterized protein n=1 Tax=Punctularia strigosozonata (strain HHB-11173) TaxID=741275 RepID=UPI0004417997|nr:uncharacterized protein PUNSTDRAFT_44597 [Punctularia strigosozonata HHB-11173 SS5]EIN09181.1 hypothetical protein PUNSTDRAFT_44597 [Punctularia strigosozonata HHB-11173 SS5]
MSLSASVEDVERFVQILESSPHLCSYISKLTIASRLLSPFSRLRLPNVRRLKLFGRPLDFTGKCQVDGVLKQLLRMADNGDLDLALEDVSLSTTLVFPYINTVDTINALLRRSEALRSASGCKLMGCHDRILTFMTETVDFSRNQLLVSATIHLRLSADRSLRRYFDHIARSLCTIESRFLRSMSLDIGVWVSDHALLAECMSSIESALADTRFERVTELRLGVAGPRADGDVYNEAALIQEYLVGIRERGVVVRPRVSDLP